MVNVTFYGVRGSTPCPCDANQRYGGNTSSVGIEAPGHEPIGLDLGTGLRFWGEQLPVDGSIVSASITGESVPPPTAWVSGEGLAS